MRRCDDATMRRCDDATMRRCDDATMRRCDDAMLDTLIFLPVGCSLKTRRDRETPKGFCILARGSRTPGLSIGDSTNPNGVVSFNRRGLLTGGTFDHPPKLCTNCCNCGFSGCSLSASFAYFRASGIFPPSRMIAAAPVRYSML